MYTVYKHTTPNEKVYIGITGRCPLARWNRGNGYRNNTHFWNAIVKYGWDNIKHEILYDGLTKNEAESMEVELIARYKSFDCKYGYNKDRGGNCTGKMSEGTKAKIRAFQLGRKRGPVSDETRQRISEGRAGITPNRVYAPLSCETKDKISSKIKGTKRNKEAVKKSAISHMKPVAQYDLDGNYLAKFESIYAAGAALGVSPDVICGCCMEKPHRKTAGGYMWRYANGETTKIPHLTKQTKGKSVVRVEDGAVFDSASMAAKATKISESSIRMACNGQRKSAGGYTWKHKEELIDG